MGWAADPEEVSTHAGQLICPPDPRQGARQVEASFGELTRAGGCGGNHEAERAQLAQPGARPHKLGQLSTEGQRDSGYFCVDHQVFGNPLAMELLELAHQETGMIDLS